MGQWDQDYVDEEVEGYFEFGTGGQGDFQFGYVQGCIDHHRTFREGKPAIEFSWEGGDAADGTPLTGRGWAVLEGEELNGMIYVHCGDHSEFTAAKGDKTPITCPGDTFPLIRLVFFEMQKSMQCFFVSSSSLAACKRIEKTTRKPKHGLSRRNLAAQPSSQKESPRTFKQKDQAR